MKAGDELDIRNSDYVWIKGRITRVINKQQDQKSFIVGYNY